MSYTEVYKVTDAGDVVWYRDIPNSFRGAFWVWKHLAERHLREQFGFAFMAAGMQRLFALCDDPEVAEDERYALMASADYVVVPRALMGRVADALERFHPPTENLQAQAGALRALLREKDCQGVAWTQTSTVDMWPEQYDDDDEDQERPRPYNINQPDSKHYILDPVVPVE